MPAVAACGVIDPPVGEIATVPLEYAQPDDMLPLAERRQAGQALRRLVPRRQHADWHPPPDRTREHIVTGVRESSDVEW